MYLNQFDNYAVQVLRPQNTKSGELEIKKIGGKYKYNIQFVLHYYLRNVKLNQITNMINGFDLPIMR